jgi:hypothetical protein
VDCAPKLGCFPRTRKPGLFIKRAAIVPVIAGFLRENVATVVLMDEFAENPIESSQMLNMRPEYSVFSHAISTLRGQLLVLFPKAQAGDYCPDTSAPNGLC